MAHDITILIPARNAAATIGRTMESFRGQGARELILIDDHSIDETVPVAESVGVGPLRVLRPDVHVNLAHARNIGLNAVRTRWAVWCDADDALLPGRIDRLVAALKEGYDIATDAQELFDGGSDRYLKDLPVPGFLSRDEDKARLFERNYLPGIGHIAFDVGMGKAVGYDEEQFGGDDSDFLWRMVFAGARIAFVHEKGYRMYAYPGSDSRNLVRQRAMVARALKKHPYEAVRGLYEKGGFSPRVTGWGLCLMAMFREEWAEAARFLEEACPVDMDPDEVLEPDGPYPVAEGWRYGFTRGTLHLLMDAPFEAVGQLESVIRWRLSADVLNNLGVAYRETGAERMAMSCFEQAWEVFPGYLDASVNMEQANAARITIHPLRMQASRSDYRPESPS